MCCSKISRFPPSKCKTSLSHIKLVTEETPIITHFETTGQCVAFYSFFHNITVNTWRPTEGWDIIVIGAMQVSSKHSFSYSKSHF